ncbi:MarR family transcriptional regulator [Sphingosinicella sp. LHD-64]|uniref:MarR family winged helix-turn-helix transcriptional regulator n=1 Tax=Sphingosinicella sp. LHD-64 TaxID=3072139 RepID=UPI00280F4A80|nr:MarR family transcriptional regulator [Sphingosinicella sp. LHD-64]MDQ8756019.1 MarR family transcriptional regulator [Sphingosinicella sp. LHD-64]
MTKESLRRQASGAAIGARLRRLSERIDREANAVYAARGIDFEQRWYGTLSLLDERGPLSVTEIARALNITHVAVSQARRSLTAAGLIASTLDPADGRRRTLHLTDAGAAFVARLWPLWDALNAVGDAINREAADPSAALDRLEGALDRMSLSERVERLLPRSI